MPLGAGRITEETLLRIVADFHAFYQDFYGSRPRRSWWSLHLEVTVRDPGARNWCRPWPRSWAGRRRRTARCGCRARGERRGPGPRPGNVDFGVGAWPRDRGRAVRHDRRPPRAVRASTTTAS
ncbi:hypothetical protein HBB16_16400 [Pseudonocardia sp. MCCB 268]|nr:hypothetical protein [Pseudonocardia cytotoxica]